MPTGATWFARASWCTGWQNARRSSERELDANERFPSGLVKAGEERRSGLKMTTVHEAPLPRNERHEDDVVRTHVERLRVNRRYKKIFPPLADEKRRALERDVAKHDVQVPIEVNEAYEILDGYHRAMAARKAGLESVPVIVRKFATLKEEALHVFRLNVQRRHLKKDDALRALREVERIITEGREVVGEKGGQPRATARPGEPETVSTVFTRAEVNRETAAVLGVSVSAVKKRRQRAQERPRTRIVRDPAVSGENSSGIAAGQVVFYLNKAVVIASKVDGIGWKSMNWYRTRQALKIAGSVAKLADTLKAVEPK